jgi:hypothetical protein
MYSIRPHSSENIELDLPRTMYSVQPIIQQSTNEFVLKDVEKRQDDLLEKIEYLYSRLVLYQNKESNEKATVLSSMPSPEELVVHLSAKQPSKNLLNLIEQFRDKLSIRTFRHSSLRGSPFNNPTQNLSSINNQNKTRSLAVIWADGENLPFIFHSHMKINDEQLIVNLLSNLLTNDNL